jgi:hypothetical protein
MAGAAMSGTSRSIHPIDQPANPCAALLEAEPRVSEQEPASGPGAPPEPVSLLVLEQEPVSPPASEPDAQRVLELGALLGLGVEPGAQWASEQELALQQVSAQGAGQEPV